MTREEQKIIQLVRESDVIDLTDGSELATASRYLFDVAIKALEQEPCEDAINDLPPVTPTRKKGKWIKKEDDTCWWYVCSECEQEPLKNRWNDDDVLSKYCPNCGAEMESEMPGRKEKDNERVTR